MKKLLALVLLFSFLMTPTFASDLEFTSCENKMSCLTRDGFLDAIYVTNASFGLVRAVCLAFPEPFVTKLIVGVGTGLNAAALILKTMPCEEEGKLEGVPRQEMLEEICRLTGGYYNQFLDKCEQ